MQEQAETRDEAPALAGSQGETVASAWIQDATAAWAGSQDEPEASAWAVFVVGTAALGDFQDAPEVP